MLPDPASIRTGVWLALGFLTTSLGCAVDNPHFSRATPGQMDGSIPDDGTGATAGNDQAGGTAGAIASGGSASGGSASGGASAPDASVIHFDTMPPAPDAFMPIGCTMNCPATVVTASIGDCIYLKAPNPDVCESQTGKGEATVDLVDQENDLEAAIFLRFDLPATIRPGTITRMTLELVVTNHPDAAAPQSGAIWQVASFVRADLFKKNPLKVGTKAIAPDLGPVIQGQIVRWVIPPQVFTGGPIYLGVFTTNSDGVNYWNSRSNKPPVLRIE